MTELSPETRALLERARVVPPLAPDHRGRLKQAVAIGIAAAPPAGGIAAGVGASWRLRAAKIALMAAAAVGSVGIAVRMASPSDDPQVVITPPPPGVASAPTSLASVTPPVDPAPPPAASAASSANVPPKERSGLSVPVTRAGAHDAKRLSPPVPPESTDSASSLREEALLVRGAHQALLAGDPARALRLLEEHAARFPTGALEPERAAEYAVALCRVGRTGDARREAAQFEESHPGSPLLSRIRSACGGAW